MSWEKRKFAEIVSKLQNGGTPSTKVPELWEGNIPWITGADFGNQKLAGIRRHISGKAVQTSSTNVVSKGDLLLVTRTGVGKMAIAPFDVAISQDITGVSFNSDISPEFIRFKLDHEIAYFLRLNQGTSINGITRNDLLDFEIKIPTSKTEQKRIAEILSTADEAIERTRALIDKYNRIKRGLMQDLLTRGIDADGNIRSKQTHKFTVKNGIEVPDDWDVVRLEEILGNNGFIQTGPFGSQLHSHEYTQEGVPVIMPQDMWEEISTKNINRISEAKANELKRHRVRENDVIFARRGDLTRCNVIQPSQVGWLCGTGCILLRQQNKIFNPDWLRLFYKSFYGQLQVSINAVGSTMVNLSGALLKNLWIYKIEIEEQNRIVEKVNQINKTIQSFIVNLAKLQAIKKGLMQDLLSGDKRVKIENGN